MEEPLEEQDWEQLQLILGGSEGRPQLEGDRAAVPPPPPERAPPPSPPAASVPLVRLRPPACPGPTDPAEVLRCKGFVVLRGKSSPELCENLLSVAARMD